MRYFAEHLVITYHNNEEYIYCYCADKGGYFLLPNDEKGRATYERGKLNLTNKSIHIV